MLPMIAVRLQLGNLLAADATTLAPAASANKMALVINNVGANENLTIADLIFATFTGSAPIAGSTGAQEVAIDPATGQQIITINPPLGGYRWVTGDAVNLPQTIYAKALTDNAGATLLGYERLDPPIALTGAGQQVDVTETTMTVNPQPIS